MRCFGFDVLQCPTCKGRMRLIAMVTDCASIRRYLKGPFRWIALSGDPEDIRVTDRAVLEEVPNDPDLARWIELAGARIDAGYEKAIEVAEARGVRVPHRRGG